MKPELDIDFCNGFFYTLTEEKSLNSVCRFNGRFLCIRSKRKSRARDTILQVLKILIKVELNNGMFYTGSTVHRTADRRVGLLRRHGRL